MGLAFNPGDVTIPEAMLGGAAGSVDIARRISKLSVFEHILKPYTAVTLEILDQTNIIQNVGLDGLNTFEATFSQPLQDPQYSGTWLLTSIEKSRSLQNMRTTAYTAQGYSNHMFNLTKVQKAYRDQPMHQVVADLVGMLGASKGLDVRATAKNMAGNKHMPYNVNGTQIMKAIRGAMLHSASAKDDSSAFTLFENRTSLVLDTIENMLNNNSGGPTYTQRVLGTDFLRDVALQQYTIISWREDARVDMTTRQQDFKQATKAFDVFSTKLQTTGDNPASTYASIPYNSIRPPSYAKDYMSKRSTKAGEADSQSITIKVPLNPSLTVGTGVTIDIQAPLGDTDQSSQDPISGPFLIAETRHDVDMSKRRMQGTTSIRCIRDVAGAQG